MNSLHRQSITALSIVIGAINAFGQAPGFDHSSNASPSDPDPNEYPEPDFVTDGGVGYAWTIDLGGEDSAYVTGHVGAWSWQDESLFDAAAGEEPVGWTHTSNWVLVNLGEDAWLTIRHERQAGVPWPSAENFDRVASTATMNPSLTIYAGYDGEGPDNHTFNNDGDIDWADGLSYLAHIDNTSASFVEQSWFLAAGQYTVSLGSNAPSNDSDRQGYKATFTASADRPAPRLWIVWENGRPKLSWPSGLTGFVLERCPDDTFTQWEVLMELSEGLAHRLIEPVGRMSVYRLRKTN